MASIPFLYSNGDTDGYLCPLFSASARASDDVSSGTVQSGTGPLHCHSSTTTIATATTSTTSITVTTTTTTTTTTTLPIIIYGPWL